MSSKARRARPTGAVEHPTPPNEYSATPGHPESTGAAEYLGDETVVVDHHQQSVVVRYPTPGASVIVGDWPPEDGAEPEVETKVVRAGGRSAPRHAVAETKDTGADGSTDDSAE